MAWGVIGKFLEKFSSFKLTKGFYRDEISAVIKNVLGVEIEPESVDYKFGIIFIKTKNPAIKNEIFINQDKILKGFSQKINPLTGEQKPKPKEIRFLN